MNVLFLTQSGQAGPSSRYRVYQLLSSLREAGIQCTVSPAISDALYTEIYRQGIRGARRTAFFQTWCTRKTDLARLNDFDAVFVQKGVFPGLYAGFEKQISHRKPIIFDFDDAIWLPREGGSPILRALHRDSSVQSILRCASAIIAGNNFLADYAHQFNTRVTVIPSAIDLTHYPAVSSFSPPSSPLSLPTVGWIGSRTTLPYLKPLAPVFQKLGVKPRVIASGDPSSLGFDYDFRQWKLESELDELSQISIGIAPLPDTPWERGKCGVKVLQYMANGIPVVASSVGVHKEMIRHGENGFLASTTDEWIQSLRSLIADADLRARIGAAGQKLVEERYSLQQIAPQVAQIILRAP